MAQQLAVLVHIDRDQEAIHQVAIFHRAVFIGKRAAAPPAAACACEAFEQFVAGPMRALFPALA